MLIGRPSNWYETLSKFTSGVELESVRAVSCKKRERNRFRPKAVRRADVVVTVTHPLIPILQGCWLKPEVHINAIGAVGPNHRELDEVAFQNATVVVESREAVRREAGDILLSNAPIHAEVGEDYRGKDHL